MKCCRCDLAGTIRLPDSEHYYCETHSHCIRCGGSVIGFVPYIIKGTETITIYVCPCVRRHEIKVHNEVIAIKARRADEEAKTRKKRGKTA